MPTPIEQVPRKPSLVTQAVAILRREIELGRWNKVLPSESELCDQLHVSRVTIRAALKELERENWVKVQQGRRREIVPERVGAGRSQPNNRVVLLTAEPLQSLPTFAVFWMDALREELSEAGFHLEVRVTRSVYGSRSQYALREVTGATHPAAWVLYRSTLEMQRWFSEHKFPGVITGSRHPGIELPSMDTDYRATCRHAAGQFLARGHRRLALLNPASGTGGERESEEGFMEAVARSGVTDASGVVVSHDGTVGGICTRLDALLRRPDAPTALLVSRPAHVLTVLGHLMRRGVRIPQDRCLISRDDDSFLDHVVPSVARYSSDPGAFARKLSKAVLEVASGGLVAARDYRIMPSFVRGETFG